MSRADLYHFLAEALAPDGPPAWMAADGRRWPLFEAAAHLADRSPAAGQAAAALAGIAAEPPAARARRHARLFSGPGRPRLWLNEAAFLGGQMLGPETSAVEKFYRAAGLEVSGSELPDHASLELAFLAHLAAADQAGDEQRFIRRHAGRWLPALGRALADSGDEVYAPVGRLLAGWLEERSRGGAPGAARPQRRASPARLMPKMKLAAACSLCGFCAQVCPTRALAIHETGTETSLALNASACVGCGKCGPICGPGVLVLAEHPAEAPPAPGWARLFGSPRCACPACGRPTVSQAEMEFLIARVGHPPWLDYCLACRPQHISAELIR